MNSRFKDKYYDKLTYVNWKGQINHPKTFTIEDCDELEKVNYLMARKFDEDFDDFEESEETEKEDKKDGTQEKFADWEEAEEMVEEAVEEETASDEEETEENEPEEDPEAADKEQ